MFIKKYLSFRFIVSGSWKNLVYVLIASVIAFLVDYYLLDTFIDSPTLIPTILGTALAFFYRFQ